MANATPARPSTEEGVATTDPALQELARHIEELNPEQRAFLDAFIETLLAASGR